jgi:hypothetical protein
MMLLRTGKATLAIALLTISAATANEVKVTASFSPNPLPENESGQLEIVLEAPISMKAEPPSFAAPDFTVMGSPGFTQNIENSSLGPSTWKRIKYEYVLMPKRSGEFRISELKATIDKENRMAPDLRVSVIPSSKAASLPNLSRGAPIAASKEESSNPAAPGYRPNSKPNNSAEANPNGSPTYPDRFNSDFTVHAVISKKKAYVGEPVVVEYYIYDYGHVQNIDVMKWPSFEGFWREDLHLITQPHFEEAYVRNIEMRRAFIARYALYGRTPGKLPLDRLRIRGRYVSDEALMTGRAIGYEVRTGF